MDHKKQIKEISAQAWKKFPKQIVIDLIQEAEDLLNTDDPEQNMRDKIGSLSYQVGCVQEVCDSNLEYEAGLLKRLKEALDKWAESVEFVNKTLGIPPEGKRR
jgi:hypothetical protein